MCDYEKYIRKFHEELEEEELERNRQQLREFVFNKEIKKQFKKNIGQLPQPIEVGACKSSS